jgi:hypothetical protein
MPKQPASSATADLNYRLVPEVYALGHMLVQLDGVEMGLVFWMEINLLLRICISVVHENNICRIIEGKPLLFTRTS